MNRQAIEASLENDDWDEEGSPMTNRKTKQRKVEKVIISEDEDWNKVDDVILKRIEKERQRKLKEEAIEKENREEII